MGLPCFLRSVFIPPPPNASPPSQFLSQNVRKKGFHKYFLFYPLTHPLIRAVSTSLFFFLAFFIYSHRSVLCCKRRSTMVENSQEYRQKYWATCSSVGSSARTAHTIACSRLLALLAPSAALTRLLVRSLPRSWESELLDGYFVCFFSYFRP